MRRLLLLGLTAVLLGACAYDPGPIRPGVTGTSGITGPTTTASSPSPELPTGPSGTTPTFTMDGCPVDDPAFCEQATYLANALVLGDSDAVLQLFRPQVLDCHDLDESTFPQCADQDRLKGYRIDTHQGESFVQRPGGFRRTLYFFVESVDPEYEDELGGAQMRILGVSTCGKGDQASYHVVYTVGLNDPESTLPFDRFLGTYGFTEQDATWAIDATSVGLYTDWQLVLDEPLEQIACGHIAPWGA